MRRLILLFSAAAVAYWGLSILGDGMPSPEVALRDGILILVIGVGLFLLAATPIASLTLPEARTGSSLFWVGFGIALVVTTTGALLIGLGQITNTTLSIWLVGFGLLLLLSLTGIRRRAGIPQRWSVAAAQRYLATRGGRSGLGAVGAGSLLLLLLFTLLGGLLRFAPPVDLLAGCGPAGCSAGVEALDLIREGRIPALLTGPSPLFTLMSALGFGLFTVDLETFRLLGVIVGTLTIPILYFAATGFVPRGSALLGTLLLTLSPLHIALSNQPEPALLALALALLYLALRRTSERSGSLAGWIAVGLAAALVLWTAPPLGVIPLLLWFLVTPPPNRRGMLLFWLSFLAATIPRYLLLSQQATVRWLPDIAGRFEALAAEDLINLNGPGGPLVSPWTLFSILGFFFLIRSIGWRGGRILLFGVILLAVGDLTMPAALSSTTSLWMAPLLLTATVALDRIVSAVEEVWRPALSSRTTLALAGVLLVVFLLPTGLTGLNAATEKPSAEAIQIAAGRYLGERFEGLADNGGEDTTIFLVPAPILSNPVTRLAAGGVFAFSSQIQPLDSTLHLPYIGSPFAPAAQGEIVYLLPRDESGLLAYLRKLYPDAPASAVEVDETPTDLIAISVNDLDRRQVEGLTIRLSEGVDGDTAGPILSGESLAIAWGSEPPMLPPFSAAAEGALYIPESGRYEFSVESEADAELTLELGMTPAKQTIIDLSAGRTSGAVELEQGVHSISFRYRSGQFPEDLSIRWQRPEGKVEPIPVQALFDFVPDSGLIALYGMDDQSEGEAAGIIDGGERRLEPLLITSPLANGVERVRWQARIAAPVDGEYTFDVETDGIYQIAIDGIEILSGVANETPAGSGLIQLTPGWHNLEVDYSARGSGSSFELLWQPPGAGLAPIPREYLLPLAGEVDLATLPIPDVVLAPPPVAPGVAEASAPAPILSVLAGSDQDLPSLPLEPIWSAGICGSAPEELSQPRGLALRPERNELIVADTGNRRLSVRALNDGSLLRLIENEAFEEPFDLGTNIVGELFLLDAVAQTIYRIDDEDSAIPIESETPFYRPRGLGVGLGGELFVADTGGARVVALDPANGAVRAQYGGPDTPLGQGQPVDVLFLPNQALYALSAESGVLWRLDQEEARELTTRSNTFDAPHFAGLNDSSFFVSDPEAGRILYVSGRGEPIAQFRSEFFARPVGLAANTIEEIAFLAVSDSQSCTLSLWQMPAGWRPE